MANDVHGAVYRDYRGNVALDTVTGEPHTVDLSHLDPAMRRYYQTGERVEVVYNDGEIERFYVGKSTGWRPSYLKIKTTRSLGGDLWGKYEQERVVSIRGTGKYRR